LIVNGGTPVYFIYDGNGNPLCFSYNGSKYYYATNLQGDITAIVARSSAYADVSILPASYWANLTEEEFLNGFV